MCGSFQQTELEILFMFKLMRCFGAAFLLAMLLPGCGAPQAPSEGAAPKANLVPAHTGTAATTNTPAKPEIVMTGDVAGALRE